MANVLDAAIPKLLAQGLVALRQMSLMPRLVNNSYSTDAKEQGHTVDIPIPSSVTTNDVTPGATPPSTADQTPTKATITLDQWKEAAFYLSDQDLHEVINGWAPKQATEAIKSLCNTVDSYLLGFYKQFYGYVSAASSGIFTTVADATSVRKVLNQQLAPLTDRQVVFDPNAEANILTLEQFINGQYTGDVSAMVTGQLNQRLGMMWWMDQNVPTHTKGTLSAGTITASAGATSLTIAAGTGSLVAGDIILIGTDTQTYVVLTATGTAPTTAITVAPALKTSPSSATIAVKASRIANIGFHRDAIAFASRTLLDLDVPNMVVQPMAVADPISGLALRLEVTREYKRWRWAYDILYGATVPRRELGVQIAG